MAAIAAVSARRMVLPRDAEIQPGLLKRFQFLVGPAAFGTESENDVAVTRCGADSIFQA